MYFSFDYYVMCEPFDAKACMLFRLKLFLLNTFYSMLFGDSFFLLMCVIMSLYSACISHDSWWLGCKSVQDTIKSLISSSCWSSIL